jgi:hypothetical protein
MIFVSSLFRVTRSYDSFSLDAIRVHLPRVVFASPWHPIGLGRSARAQFEFMHFRTYTTAHFTRALNPKLTGGCNKP